MKVKLLPAVVLAFLATGGIRAQELDDQRNDAIALDRVVVSGKRASLASAQERKREKIEIVDSVVAKDIAKLPDVSVTDALQRVTGVQVARDRGDGAGVAIRGLTQMETTLNGREVFTAGNGRNLDFADIPAEMLAGIDVYKTASAGQIEGGIGGLVDLRTRRPFDFIGRQVAGSVRATRGDLAGRTSPQHALLLSDRWQADSAGEFGALLNLVHQEQTFREDQKSTGAPVARSIAGAAVVTPNGTTETTSRGTRTRTGANLVLQWRPTQRLDLYAEGNLAELRIRQDSYQIGVAAPATGAGGVSLFPGTNDVQRITWANAPAYTAGAARDTSDKTTQFAVGGSWSGRELTLKSDLSYTKSRNNLDYSAIVLNGTAAALTQDLSGDVPASAVGGANLNSFPGGFASAGIWHATRPFDGDLKAATFDAEYRLAGDLLDAVSAGVRLARRHAANAPGQIGFYPATVAAPNAAGLVIANPYGDFFPGSASIGNYLVGDPSHARDVHALCAALGIACALPAGNPLGTWDIGEETRSAYLMAAIKSADLPLDGNVGLRIVQTHEVVSGNQTLPAGGVAPIGIDHRYVDTLPSMNLRYELGRGLYLRGAASKTITRPDFNQLSPSLTLNPVQHIGSAGNPALRPVRADNLDLAVERYFGKTTSVHLTAFAKKVDGFVTTLSGPETYDGASYQVSRPRNANRADIKGVEIGYQQFYDFLPGWLRGFGMQANYTHVDSETLDAALGEKLPLQNLSPNSLNLVGMYEKGPLSVRIAWNWRDEFLLGVTNAAGVGVLPKYMSAYGWLDASLTYRFSDKIALSIEGQNLTRTVRSSYYGVETLPESAWLNDRQLGATVTVTF